MDPLDTIASTAEAAFACDARGRIVAWNNAAETLLGHRASNVIDRHCYEVLDGHDVFGNRFCDQHCPIRSMVQRHEPVHQFRLRVRTAHDALLWTSASVFVLVEPDGERQLVMHLLEPVDEESARCRERQGRTAPGCGKPREVPGLKRGDSTVESSCSPLTTRESEILRLLAGGATTLSIADRLSISDATVRNHVHHILGKLNAHSRLEAVSLAIRNQML